MGDMMLTIFAFAAIIMTSPLVYFTTREIVNYCLEELKYAKTRFEKFELYCMLFAAFTQPIIFLFASYMFVEITL